jgi:hypothetical protein
MADLRPPSPTAGGDFAVKTSTCPSVGDLIEYALGRCSGDQHRRIEAHLQAGGCRYCEGWVERAARRGEARSGVPPHGLDPRSVSPSLPGPPPVPIQDSTPIPESAKWQRQAFRDLERRLQALEGD